ncbi:MAG: hypothetical protein QMC85_06300 [Methanocellales archaeon]|nr:hypothetical protein [Methanocellales archaeon]MDI6902900.1 hypothetical protein [Methanocellales archaeon]
MIDMATTIQVRGTTKDVLDAIKNEKKLRSYDEVIQTLIKESKKLRQSDFGSLPKLRSFVREEIDRFD